VKNPQHLGPVLRWKLWYRPHDIDIEVADDVLAAVRRLGWSVPISGDSPDDRRRAAFIAIQSARSAVKHGWTRGWAEVLAAAEGRVDR
jgi:hypothetical protein